MVYNSEHSEKYLSNPTYPLRFPPNLKWGSDLEEGLMGCLLTVDARENTNMVRNRGRCVNLGTLHPVTVATGGQKPELFGQITVQYCGTHDCSASGFGREGTFKRFPMAPEVQRKVAALYVPWLESVNQKAKAARLREAYLSNVEPRQVHSAPATQQRPKAKAEAPLAPQSSPIRPPKRKASDLTYNSSIKRSKPLPALAPFPLSSSSSDNAEDNSDSDVEIMDGWWRPKEDIGKDVDKWKGKGKVVDVGGNRWEANVAGPSSGRRQEPADDFGVIYTCNELIKFVKVEQNLAEDTKAVLHELQDTLDKLFGL
ncbi:hypothetical protein BT96DRAFT_1008202 [Gymnopus androsaceus JB14]|uniref:Uncharacterized protein n=1 Tax=Gymnopus androsaceus JB14 TaxID=1447944 RepID=A0A6A4GFG4_9AGAR|nr:hypothetical protein BT96DRAFT_1008202 [Gymnopus androsaceus JB14]